MSKLVPHLIMTTSASFKYMQRTYITLGGDTESSNPSRLIFSINIPI